MKILKYCKALSDETRIRLFQLLLHYELNVGEIVTIMGMGQSRISRHLKILSDNEIIIARRDGLWIFYHSKRENNDSFLQSVAKIIDNEKFFAQDLAVAKDVVTERELKSRDFFNAIATRWDNLSQEMLGGFDIGEKILELVEPNKKIADLGCGAGFFLSRLAKQSEIVIGIDNAPKMLAVAKKRLAHIPNIDLRIGELSHLPLKDKEVDTIIVSMVLHHLVQPHLVIEEIHRVLRPNGTVIIADFIKHNQEKMRTDYGDRWLGFEPEEIEQWFTKLGLHITNHSIFSVPNIPDILIMTGILLDTSKT